MKKTHVKSIVWIIVLVILSVAILFPLFKPGFIVTDDGDWMVIRLTAFYQSFADGQFPVRFLSRLNYNYGYPVANFLYPGFLYIGSILRLLKLPYTLIVKLILGGSIGISVIFLFFWLKKFFSEIASFIGALSFLISPYVLYDLYKRGSVGEILSTAFAILLLWCIEYGYTWLLSPIMALFLISHNIVSLLLGIMIGGYIVIRKKKNAIVPLCIGMCMASFFWMPALFERAFVQFDSTVVSNPFNYLKTTQILILMNIPFFVPLALIITKKKLPFYNEYFFFWIICVFSIVTSSFIVGFIWRSPIFMRYIQFPYRMLSFLFIAGPWFLAYFVSQLKTKGGAWIGILLLSLLFVGNIPLLINVRSRVYEEGFYTTNEGTTTVQDEYMPKWVKERPKERAPEKLIIFSGKGIIRIKSISTKNIIAALKLDEKSIIQFNMIYYPGWGAILDGRPVPLSYQNQRGLMQVIVPQGEHTLIFEFRESGFRYISDVISSIGIMLYGAYIIFLLSCSAKKRKRI